MAPSSAAIADPARPARRNAMRTGPSSFVMASPTIGPRIPWVTSRVCSAVCTTSVMPTNSESRAPIGRVSVPMRTSCTTMRRRSRGTCASVRKVAPKRRVASPSTWSTASTPPPRRAKGRGRPAPRMASVASGRSPGRAAGGVPRADKAAPLAGEEPPQQVPVAAAVGGGVPAQHAPERRPEREHAAIHRGQAVDERGRLAEAAAVDLAAAHRGEEREQARVPAARVVALLLAPPQDEERVTPLEMVGVAVEGAPAVAGPSVEARGEAVVVDAAVERGEPPRRPARVAERALLEDERPWRADGLVARALVHRVRAREHAVGARVKPAAVAGGEEGEVHADVVPPVARHEALAAQVEGPEDVARALAAGDLLAAPERPHAHAPAVGATHRRDEGEAVEARVDARLGQPEVGREHDRLHPPVAEKVRHVEVEWEHAQVRAGPGIVAIEDEREEGVAARPRVGRRQWTGGRGAGAIREQQQSERLVAILPAARREGEEDVRAVVAHRAAPLVEPEERTDVEVAGLGGAHELDERAEGRPAKVLAFARRVAEERPDLEVEAMRRRRQRMAST